MEYRKIPSLKFLYEISEDGKHIRNVKSKKQLKIYSEKPKENVNWGNLSYKKCQFNIGGKIYKRMVHNLVAECWLGEKPIGTTVDHIDRDVTNNHYKNLRYATKSEQMKNRSFSATSSGNMPAKKIMLAKKEDCVVRVFRSYSSCANWLIEKTENNRSFSTIIGYMYKKRKNIYGYDVIYLGDEG